MGGFSSDDGQGLNALPLPFANPTPTLKYFGWCIIGMKDKDALIILGGILTSYYLFVAKPQQQFKENVAGVVDRVINIFTPAPDPHVTVIPTTPAQAKEQAVQQAAIRSVGGRGVTQVEMAQAGIPRADQVRYIPFAEQIGYTEQPIISAGAYENLLSKSPASAGLPLTATVGAVQTQPAFTGGGITATVLPALQQFWVNPLTGTKMGAYVAGQTPQSVLSLRGQDIYPAIRSY